MKRLILLGCLICTCSFFVYADEDCTGALQEAKSAYNAGDYQKAKRLYDYVVSECGNNYGNAAVMLRQCEEMLNPKLSVSRSYITIGASSGSTTLSVTSNRNWELRNTNSNMFSVYKNGSTITINYYANSSSSSRSDYFDVVTADGSKSVRINISQSAASIASTLSVNSTSISSPASGKTEYIIVNSNTNWEIQYATGTMYRTTRSGNMVKVEIFANSATSSRTDYFYIKTADGSKTQKISLTQYGKTSASSYNAAARIKKVWIEHNVYQNSIKGMKIHVRFDVDNMRNCTGRVVAYFYHQGGTALRDANNSYRTTSGEISCGESFTPSYINTAYNDFVLFMPYSELHCTSYSRYNLRFFVSIFNDHSREMTQSNWVQFTLTN